MKMRLGWGSAWPEFEPWIVEAELPTEEGLRNDIATAQIARDAAVAQMDRNRVIGEKRQRELMVYDGWLIDVWHAHLPTGTPIAVDMQLLALAWSHGDLLAGRQFDVLANRYPLKLLHASLDEAARRDPCVARHMLFRADAQTVESERQALFSATRILSPHSWVNEHLRNDGARTVPVVALEWVVPAAKRTFGARAKRCAGTPRVVLYPDGGLARRGALDVAQALWECSSPIDLVTFEGAPDVEGIWAGLSHMALKPEQVGSLIEMGVDLVVLPSYIEYRPEVLLRALAHQVPVLATPQCGLRRYEGLTVFDRQDLSSRLSEAIDEVLDPEGFYAEVVGS